MADNTITTKTRTQVIEDYQANYLNRCPDGLTGPGTAVYRDAVLLADQLMPLYANSVKAGRLVALDERTEAELRTLASDMSIPLSGAVGSGGYVTIRAATGGTTIFAGDELLEPTTRLVFYCTTTAAYANGADVPVSSRSTGPATNLAAGKVLQWSSPRPGCASTCTVTAQTNGDGLSGGADADGREQIIAKIRDAKANPIAAGNAAQYRAWIKQTPGVQVEEAFAWPVVDGPATTAWGFTVAPDKYGSRIPTPAQVAAVRVAVEAAAPGHDMGVSVTLAEEDLAVAIGVDWDTALEQWTSASRWPAYLAQSPVSGSGALLIGYSPSPVQFEILTSNGDYTTCGDPVPGDVLAVWDQGERKFVRKTVLTVAGSGPWTITCDTTFGASDTVYTPVTDQRVSPWSDGLAQFVAPVIAAFDAIGPGEIQAVGYLDGRRGYRVPESPREWPDRLTKSLELQLESISVVKSLDILEGLDVVATPSVTPNLLRLSDLSAFPRP